MSVYFILMATAMWVVMLSTVTSGEPGNRHPLTAIHDRGWQKKGPPLLPPEAHGRPVFSPLWELPDPTISKDGDWYYVYATGQGIEARRSRDLIDWEVLLQSFPIPSQLGRRKKFPEPIQFGLRISVKSVIAGICTTPFLLWAASTLFWGWRLPNRWIQLIRKGVEGSWVGSGVSTWQGFLQRFGFQCLFRRNRTAMDCLGLLLFRHFSSGGRSHNGKIGAGSSASSCGKPTPGNWSERKSHSRDRRAGDHP